MPKLSKHFTPQKSNGRISERNPIGLIGLSASQHVLLDFQLFFFSLPEFQLKKKVSTIPVCHSSLITMEPLIQATNSSLPISSFFFVKAFRMRI